MLLSRLISLAAHALLAYGLHLILILLVFLTNHMILDRGPLLFPLVLLLRCLWLVKVLRVVGILLLINRLGMPD